MALSLYDTLIPNFKQTLGGLAGVLEKAEAHCAGGAMLLEDCVGKRLIADMGPLSFQVQQAITHSVGAIEATKVGLFSPNMTPPPNALSQLKDDVGAALIALGRYTPAEINALEGRDMAFQMGERRMEFTAENFLLSLSVPNFYFHATTAYNILRHNGVALGKGDYMGRPRLKPR